MYVILSIWTSYNIQMQSDLALRQAVQQQLDLILKIEEERKLLKKENRVLKDQHQKMMNTLKKYNVERIDQCLNTDPTSIDPPLQKPIMLDEYAQVDMDVPQVNTSKLSSAHDLLKQLNMSSQSLCSRCEDQLINTTCNEPPKQTKRSTNSNQQQVSNQIVRLAKEIASLKKELKDCDAKGKQKEKQLKQMRKCLEVKSEALEKSRKQFNQLSQLFNGDKFKSLRSLQTENKELKARNSILQEQGKANAQLKKTLLQLTAEYEQYRQDRESRIVRLLAQLKEKDSKCDELTKQLQKSYSLL